MTDLKAALTDEEAEKAIARTIRHHKRHPWLQPGDQPWRRWMLLFDDPAQRTQYWEGDDAEVEALAAYALFSPTWNCTLMAAVPFASPGPALRGEGGSSSAGQGATPEDASGMPKDFLPADVKAAVEYLAEQARNGTAYGHNTAAICLKADLRLLLESHTALTEANERLRAEMEQAALGLQEAANLLRPKYPSTATIFDTASRRARALLARQAIGEGENAG